METKHQLQSCQDTPGPRTPPPPQALPLLMWVVGGAKSRPAECPKAERFKPHSKELGELPPTTAEGPASRLWGEGSRAPGAGGHPENALNSQLFLKPCPLKDSGRGLLTTCCPPLSELKCQSYSAHLLPGSFSKQLCALAGAEWGRQDKLKLQPGSLPGAH